MASWIPKYSLAEVDKLICTPGVGSPFEVEERVIDGRLQRVYKNLYPSVRKFWLWATNMHSDMTYVTFEQQRYSFKDMLNMSAKTAALFRERYSVQKGDRVAICSRNYPSYFTAFWAAHLLGAVPVLVNAWLPIVPLKHCLSLTDCKLILLDSERANIIEPIVSDFKAAFLVLESHEGKGSWDSMESYNDVLSQYTGDGLWILQEDLTIEPEDNATVIFTSGTTGLPKGVLSTQRMFLSVLCNATAPSARAWVRNGDKFPPDPVVGPQRGYLLPTPIFHVTGTSITLNSAANGVKIILMRKWNVDEAVKLILRENIRFLAGVPTTISDLVDSRLAKEDHVLDSITYGGAPLVAPLAERSAKTFPNTLMCQAYGLTETNANVIAFAGLDFIQRPSSTGLPLPATEIRIVKDNASVPSGTVGEVWLRGPNVMKCYWGDKAATDKVLTKDGWFKSGDLGYLDEEGFLYIKDRIKDIIIRGGENVDSVSVESALYSEPGVMEAAAVGIPDKRLGELVAALVKLKPGYTGKVNEKTLLALAKKLLPRFAVPVMIVLQDQEFEHTPSGKVLKAQLRIAAQKEWERRHANRAKL
ncbi:acetyl-CoA synthetase-like protein [Hymenopellis radicata]|nr:acetyl-CoA synthetase-like protein [Hymenopellis radicata]